MKVFVTGAAGLLGTDITSIAASRGWTVVPSSHLRLDVTDRSSVIGRIADVAPDAVLHCAAFTDVDRAESEPDLSFEVNVEGTRNVAHACRAIGSLMVYFSTDFVFDGMKASPYEPDDEANPVSVYGRSKLAGELAVAGSAAQHLIVRTSWLFGAAGPNFVSAILSRAREGHTLRVVDDQVGRPTWSRDLAETTLALVETGARGVFHAANAGVASWFELARRALEFTGLGAEVVPVSSVEWGSSAARPPYSVLDLTRTEQHLGRSMVAWPEALRSFLMEQQS